MRDSQKNFLGNPEIHSKEKGFGLVQRIISTYTIYIVMQQTEIHALLFKKKIYNF